MCLKVKLFIQFTWEWLVSGLNRAIFAATFTSLLTSAPQPAFSLFDNK